MAPQNILLFGATGAIGRFILNALLAQRSQFGRIAIFTSPRTAETKGEQLKKQGIEVIVGSIEDESAVKAAYEGKYTHTHTHTQSASPSSMDYTSNPLSILYSILNLQQRRLTSIPGITTVISALGRNTLAHQIPLIRLAAASPTVKWFFPSEYGTDIAYSPASAHEKPHQQKLKVRAVLENEISRDDLDYSYIVTGPFAEMYLHFTHGLEEAGGWDVRGRKAVLLGAKGEERVSLTTMEE